MKKKFIKCPQCGEKSFIKTENIYEGFKVIGVKKTCGLCGYEIKDEDKIEFIEDPKILSDEPEKKFCRDCIYYVVHPWTQKCTLLNKEVTALDSCEKFQRKDTS